MCASPENFEPFSMEMLHFDTVSVALFSLSKFSFINFSVVGAVLLRPFERTQLRRSAKYTQLLIFDCNSPV